MSLDYRTMVLSDWFWLGVIALLCVIIFWGFWFKIILPWRSIQRMRNPDQTDEMIGEPTKAFVICGRIFGVMILLMGVVVLLLPFLPLVK